MLREDLRKKIEEATRLIDEGKESYGSLAKRFGVSKSTVYLIHEKRLEKEIERLKEVKDRYHREIRELTQKFEKIKRDLAEKEKNLRRLLKN